MNNHFNAQAVINAQQLLNLIEKKNKNSRILRMIFEKYKSSALQAEILEKQSFTFECDVAVIETALITSYGELHTSEGY